MAKRTFEDLAVGQEIACITRGPMTTAHIMRWSAAVENWHRIHYDQRFAVEHDGLPDVLVNGSWKQHQLFALLTELTGDTGWIWKLSFQYRRVNRRGDVLTAWGRVTSKEVRDGLGLVGLDIGIRDADGVEGTPGTAVVVLPLGDGSPVPYPFDPAQLFPPAGDSA